MMSVKKCGRLQDWAVIDRFAAGLACERLASSGYASSMQGPAPRIRGQGGKMWRTGGA